MPTTGDRKKDPFRGFRFKIELGSVVKSGGFRECSGLDASNDAVDYREGPDEPTIRKMPGLKKFSSITLKRGITDDMDLWKWRKQVMDGDIEKARMNGSIILIDDKGDEKVRWNFVSGWPTKWTGPSLNATGNEVAIDTLEITHEGIDRAS